MTLTELLERTKALPVPNLILRQTDEVASETIAFVELQDNKVVGFIALADMPEEKADPVGWWIVYAWTDSNIRGSHIGTDLLIEAFHTFKDTPPYLIRKPDNDRVWGGRFGYIPDDRDWFFLNMNKSEGYQLYTTNKLILTVDDD